MKISVICIYNNEKIFHNQLLKSLNKQDIDFELIALDNTKNKYSCASVALNLGASQAKGDILVFSHQDIYLKTSHELRAFADAIANCNVGTVVGTQGVKEVSKIYYSNITAGKEYDNNLSLEYKLDYYDVSCTDEGFFGLKKQTWEKHNFDGLLCDNWHLYAVEYCLWSRKNNYKVYVYPIQLHHFSMGVISLAYMKNLKSLCKFYHKDFRYVWTTCYKVRTNFIYINLLYYAWVLNRIFHRNLK